ncbi:cuticle protein 12.5-like [Topomyia yanbarensis]|uniref:cuticle protein 12.5-like n=1 Tax=Topomyia yanbarensis TaxID=2498891 RepID=UPI00273B9064|nr:cuticle protein 12.5-like [Topomyia yanbarensis]
MFTKLFLVATVAIACVSASAKPSGLIAPLAYSAPLVAAPAYAPAVAYTTGYANVGDSAVVSSYNSQFINPAFAAYSAYTAAPAYAAPAVAYTAAAAPLAAPLAYAAGVPFAGKVLL